MKIKVSPPKPKVVRLLKPKYFIDSSSQSTTDKTYMEFYVGLLFLIHSRIVTIILW